jgi:uncharacterized protein DUF5658
MFRICAPMTLLMLLLVTTPVLAADEAAAASLGTIGATIAQGAGSAREPHLTRPAVLPALYVSYAALQVFDVYSTRLALARGAREANPVMQQVVGNQAALWAFKASATAGAVVAAERLWKKNNKTAAVAVLIASNAAAAVVAARNASVLRRQR